MNNSYEKQVQLFKDAVYFFQKELNLLNWEVSIFEQNKQETRGSCYFTQCFKQASIFYTKDWLIDENTNKDEILIVAFHECCELLFSEIRECLSAYYNKEIVDGLIHSQIRLLENILFPYLKIKFYKS